MVPAFDFPLVTCPSSIALCGIILPHWYRLQDVVEWLVETLLVAEKGRGLPRLAPITDGAMLPVLYEVNSSGDGTSEMTELQLEVRDGDITITLPGTSYTVTYYKPKNSPQLLAKRIARKDDPRVAMRLAEFLAAAWRLANNKARELGWIV
jgi:hypothetical protein